jgi:primosomal protein N' (replication factor Y)
VATQAAAKGHNFPKLTLVGVVDADLGLRGGDLRAAERTYQLLAQATGRAGRKDRPGRALLQTYAPRPRRHAGAEGAGPRRLRRRRDGRAGTGRGCRRSGGWAAVIASGADATQLDDFLRKMAEAAPNSPGVSVYGPADAPLGLIRGRRRKRFLVRADRTVDLSAYMAAWRARVRPARPDPPRHRHRPLQLPLSPARQGVERLDARREGHGGIDVALGHVHARSRRRSAPRRSSRGTPAPASPRSGCG